ncbi:MAG TPA: hypothetical protein EYP60_02585 [bacterium (Candidatus Stahlbacteria)]|nr:hypothetical protein [Candidatus Stahlbacteria bacterium]
METKIRKLSRYIPLYLFFVVSCRESPLIFRIGANYIPIENIGNYWVYVSQVDTIRVEVKQKEVVESRECYLLERNAQPEYWWKGEGKLDEFHSEVISVGGNEFLLGNFWIPHLKLPLFIGNKWEDEFMQQTILYGDTITLIIQVEGGVESIEEIGTFDNCYKVQYTKIIKRESKAFGNVNDTTISYEWYAPNVGIVKRIVNGREENLIRYKVKI